MHLKRHISSVHEETKPKWYTILALLERVKIVFVFIWGGIKPWRSSSLFMFAWPTWVTNCHRFMSNFYNSNQKNVWVMRITWVQLNASVLYIFCIIPSKFPYLELLEAFEFLRASMIAYATNLTSSTLWNQNKLLVSFLNCLNYWPPPIWYFQPFGNVGLQSPRDLPCPYPVSSTHYSTLRETPSLMWLKWWNNSNTWTLQTLQAQKTLQMKKSLNTYTFLVFAVALILHYHSKGWILNCLTR